MYRNFGSLAIYHTTYARQNVYTSFKHARNDYGKESIFMNKPKKKHIKYTKQKLRISPELT